MKYHVRLMNEQDIPAVATYFQSMQGAQGEVLARSIGFDPVKLNASNVADPVRWQARLEKPHNPQNGYMLSWLLDDVIIGYAALNNIIVGQKADFHVHIFKEANRRQGLSAYFLPLSLNFFFASAAQPERIIIEPNADNVAANRALAKLGLTFKVCNKTAENLTLARKANSYMLTQQDMVAINDRFSKLA